MKSKELEQFESATKNELKSACGGSLHPKAVEGLRLFDAREYWHAHEALEEAWLAEEGHARSLYKGILQVGVAYLQVQRGNYIGVLKMYQRSQVWLTPWLQYCMGIDIDQLKYDLDLVIVAVRRLGPERLDEFDLTLLKPVQWERDT